MDTRSALERGEAYAKEVLTQGSEEIQTLFERIDTAREFGEYNDFDRGAEKVLKDAGHYYEAGYE